MMIGETFDPEAAQAGMRLIAQAGVSASDLGVGKIRGMVTGDQTPKDAELEPDDVDDSDLLECRCKWQHMDTGSQFYSRIVWADPHCPAHRRP